MASARAADSEGTAPISPDEWVSPGVSRPKLLLIGAGITLAAALFFFIAWYERANMIVSSIIGAVFILCFVWYLRIEAPTPFTIRLDAEHITRTERGGAPATIPWAEIVRVKEEVFKSGTAVSLSVYHRRPGGNPYRAFVVYRDDVPRFDALLAAVRARLPEQATWQRETVHE
jgi:hypothetical protein